MARCRVTSGHGQGLCFLRQVLQGKRCQETTAAALSTPSNNHHRYMLPGYQAPLAAAGPFHQPVGIFWSHPVVPTAAFFWLFKLESHRGKLIYVSNLHVHNPLTDLLNLNFQNFATEGPVTMCRRRGVLKGEPPRWRRLTSLEMSERSGTLLLPLFHVCAQCF